MSATQADPASNPQASALPVNATLLAEIQMFRADCTRRYRFNNLWDTVLTTVGILLSIAVVAAGFVRRPEVSAILGAVIGAIVTAQKAFPFGQRAGFYRLLIGQVDNLSTRADYKLWNTLQTVNALSALRMDFAQELPRGTNVAQDNASAQSHAPTAPGTESETTGDKPFPKPQGSTAAAAVPAFGPDLPDAPAVSPVAGPGAPAMPDPPIVAPVAGPGALPAVPAAAGDAALPYGPDVANLPDDAKD